MLRYRFLAVPALFLSGCLPAWPDDRPGLVVATYLDRPTRDQLAAAYPSARIDWIVLGPDDPLKPVLDPTARVDVLLGGPLEEFQHFGPLGHFAEVDKRTHLALQIDVADRSATWLEGKSRGLDPRSSAHVLRSWIGLIDRGPSDEWYRRVLDFARSGKSDLPRPSELGTYREGVAVLRGAGNPDEAAKLLAFLASSGRAEAAPIDDKVRAGADDLLADLIGAMVVDASAELETANRTLNLTQNPALPEARLVEPPPWPPASVAKILARDDGLALLDVLAAQLVPEPTPRAWLVQSWQKPIRPIDRNLLAEVANAEGGVLLREPRLRAWLRAEWSTWAKQRYRRVARLASGEWKGPRESRPNEPNSAKDSPSP